MSDVKCMDCLLIGRFQPFHNGHLEVVRKISRECDELIIGIGSAQISHTLDNPFTAGERHLMISRALREEGIRDYFLVPIVDINQYGVWVSHVRSMVPPFERVYTNNPLTKRLFSEAGYDVVASPMFNREHYSGTEIRKRMMSGDDWRQFVPAAVADVIDSIDGVRRMRDLVGQGEGDAGD
ncbi:MAG: nicotinamide-nucleotide adenylyltransferase [Methanomassiliicoccales archaeon]|nr:nicotinamide-nucleotide adenylyltransferase [Methanomassiliicoccales archaeon]